MSALITSEARVPVADLQQVTGPDLTAQGVLGQGSLDNVVLNCLFAGSGYTGMAATVGTSATAVNVAPGWLLKGGPAYALRDAFSLDLSAAIASVPDAAKTLKVLIVADGQEFDSSEVRTFLDASKKPTNPADPWPTVTYATPTRKIRSAVVSKVAGTADVQPQAPAYNAILCLIATVVVSNTGIVSITQNTAQQITRLDQVAPLVAAQGAMLATLQSASAGLLSSVSSLAMALALLKSSIDTRFTALQQALAALESRQVAATNPGTVLNVTDTYTDTTSLTVQANNPGYSVGSGLAFPQTTPNPIPYYPLQFNGPNAKILGNRYLVPAYTEVGGGNYSYWAQTLSQRPGYQIIIKMNASGVWNVAPQLEGFGVARTRYGATYGAQDASQILATADPAALFAINAGDITYSQSWQPWTSYAPEIRHDNGYWHDLSSRGNWAPRTAGAPTGNLPAASLVMQTSTDDMMTYFRLYGGSPEGSTIRLLVCDDVGGAPDPTGVLMDVTTTCSGGTYDWTFPYPLLRKAGRRLHYVFLSNDASIRISPDVQSADPTLVKLLYRSPGAVSGAWTQDQNGALPLCDYRVARFTAGAPIELNLLYLGAGIDSIDLLTPAVVPQGCDLLYGTIAQGSSAYQRFGKINPADATTNLLAGRPSQVRLFLEMVTTGTTGPVIDLQASASGNANTVTARQGATLTAQSPVRTPSGPVTKVTRQVTLSGFNPALHTYIEKLDTGANYATKAAPTTTAAPVAQADGTTLIVFSWTLAAAVPSFMLDYLGNTSDTSQQFRIPKAITTAAT